MNRQTDRWTAPLHKAPSRGGLVKYTAACRMAS